MAAQSEPPTLTTAMAVNVPVPVGFEHFCCPIDAPLAPFRVEEAPR